MKEFLITGANGFLGKYIVDAVSNLGFRTLGLSGCDYNLDLSAMVPEFTESFSKVIHAAGLAHIQAGLNKSAQRFFEVNETGTANLLDSLEKVSPLPMSFVFISTVAVYGLDEGESIEETAPLNGSSPYALSKINAENLVRKWGQKNNVNTLILRLPLIAGAHPPGNLGAMIRAIKRGFYFRIGDGSANRSMVLAEDVAGFIASCEAYSGTYNLTDGCHPSIKELDEAIASRLNRRIKKTPSSLVKLAARTGDFLPLIPINSVKYKKLTSSLTFSDAKARREISWQSRPVVDNFEV